MFIFEISLLLIILLVGASIIWSTVVVGISPMPSSKKARQAIMALVETAGDDAVNETDKGSIVDLGSGWGSLLIPMAKKYPQRKVIGYELSILPWLVTLLIGKLLRLKNLTVHRQNFLHTKLPAASVIVCYLYPAGMAALADKLAEQKVASFYLISNNFALPSCQPEKTIRVDDFYQSPVYRYRVDSGEWQ